MTVKRKPFFIKGNFQIKFILCFIAALVLGVIVSALVTYTALNYVFEQASFSAHMMFSSSGQLILQILLKVNAVMAGIIVLIGAGILFAANKYSDHLFHSLAQALEHLEAEDYSYRIKSKGRFAGKELISQFNRTAIEMSKQSQEAASLITQGIQITQQKNAPPDLEQLNKIHQALLKQYQGTGGPQH